MMKRDRLGEISGGKKKLKFCLNRENGTRKKRRIKQSRQIFFGPICGSHLGRSRRQSNLRTELEGS